MPSTLRPVSGRLLVAAAAWWGASLCWGSAAQASCGDYLVHGPGAMLDPSGLTGDAGSAIQTTGHAELPQPHVPCRGPHCRSQNRTPAAPAPTIELVVERWAHSMAFSEHAAIASGTLQSSSDREPAAIAPEPLTPPPRSC